MRELSSPSCYWQSKLKVEESGAGKCGLLPPDCGTLPGARLLPALCAGVETRRGVALAWLWVRNGGGEGGAMAWPDASVRGFRAEWVGLHNEVLSSFVMEETELVCVALG